MKAEGRDVWSLSPNLPRDLYHGDSAVPAHWRSKPGLPGLRSWVSAGIHTFLDVWRQMVTTPAPGSGSGKVLRWPTLMIRVQITCSWFRWIWFTAL